MKTSATPRPMDFFNRIVVKARGAESSIAPRLPALFEPVAGVELAPTAAIEEELATSVAARELQEPQPASIPARSPGMHELRPLTPRLVKTTEQGDERAPGEPDRRERAAEAAPVATLRPLPVLAGRVARSATVANERRPNDDKAEFGVMRTDKTELGRTQECGHEASGIDEPKEGHQESGVLIPKPAAVPVPYPTQREAPGTGSATARDLTSNPPTAEQPPPVINVTIGRVEVRAVQPPGGKPRSEPSRTKPLSLDDYLKQRGGDR